MYEQTPRTLIPSRYLHISRTNTFSKLAQRAWLHFKQRLQRIQFSPPLFSENRQVQNMQSASLSSPDRGWTSWWSRGSNVISSSFTHSLFLKWIPRVNKARRLARMMPLLVRGVPDGFFLLHITVSFSRHLLCGTDNLIPELPNIAYSCGQHGPVTAWFRLERPGSFIPVAKTFTFLVVGVHGLSQWNCFCLG
jgi:hypothetical protein